MDKPILIAIVAAVIIIAVAAAILGGLIKFGAPAPAGGEGAAVAAEVGNSTPAEGAALETVYGELEGMTENTSAIENELFNQVQRA
jgi:hypothetical protein